MPVFIILKKLLPYLKYLLIIVAVIFLFSMWKNKSNQADKLTQELNNYKRQVAGQLTTSEQKFQDANDKLGIAQSKLMKQDDLIKKYKEQKIKDDAAFEAYKKQFQIELESYEQTIAQLTQEVNGGNTSGVVSTRKSTDPKPDSQYSNIIINPENQELSYTWNSGDGRFSLYDPDVFTSNNEIFELHQEFRITGEIYREKNGFLKTHRLTLEEVVPNGKNKDGSTKYKAVNQAEVVDSQFNYSVPSPDSWVPKRGIFGVWGVVSTDFALDNGLNPSFLLGTGVDFIRWKGLGLGTQLYFNATEWKDSVFGLDLSYRPTIKNTQLNVALSVGLATQFRQPFQSYVPLLGISFILW